MSGQYSSYLGASGAETIKWTERSRYLDTRESTSSWSDVAIAPSGQVIRTGGKGRPVRGLSTYSARNSNIRAHFLGFLALTTIPVDGSSRAYDRSPRRPRSVRSDAPSSSPNMDFTGYRHKEANCPAASSEEFIGPSRSYRCAESVDGTSKFRVETEGPPVPKSSITRLVIPSTRHRSMSSCRIPFDSLDLPILAVAHGAYLFADPLRGNILP